MNRRPSGSSTARRILFTIGYVAVGLVAVGAVGCLTFHRQVFHFPEPVLSFVYLGLTAGIIYAAAQMFPIGYAALVIALLFVVRLVLSPRTFSLAAAAVDALLVGLALLAGAYAQKSLTRIRFGRFVSMGFAVGAGYALLTLLLLMISYSRVNVGAVWEQTLLGAKLGTAMGLGFELVDLIGPRPEYCPFPDLESLVDATSEATDDAEPAE